MKTLLLIEDDQDLSRLYATIFKKHGWQVVQADDGQKGVQLALEKEPDIVLLDLMLPEQGGLHVLKILRSLPETQSIPVAVMTAYPNPEYREEAEKHGVSLYLFKQQIEPWQLVDKIEELITRPKD